MQNLLQLQQEFKDLFFFTDRQKVDNFIIIDSLPANSKVIFREYDLSIKEREDLLKKIQKICLIRNLKLIIGKDLILAQKMNIDAIHFSDYDDFLSHFYQIRQDYVKDFFISCSFHSQESILKYQNLDLDIRFLSPIFKTNSHIGQENIGIKILKKLTEEKGIRICPLGGINKKNIKQLKNLNISGIAGIDIFKKII